MNPANFKIISLLFLLHFTACREVPSTRLQEDQEKTAFKAAKPGASNYDTLNIETAAVVFFQADSLQLQKIKSVTTDQVFESSMHEYEYQVWNGHNYLNANWPRLKVIDTKNARYLLFKKKGGAIVLIDLDTKDPAGMYLFDGVNDPKPADMMNIDTEVPVFFSSEKNHVSK